MVPPGEMKRSVLTQIGRLFKEECASLLDVEVGGPVRPIARSAHTTDAIRFFFIDVEAYTERRRHKTTVRTTSTAAPTTAAA